MRIFNLGCIPYFLFIKRWILLLPFLLMQLEGTAQSANSIWIFGDSAGVNFSNVNNPVPISSGMDGRGSSSSIADSSGSLILYAATLGFIHGDWVTRIFNSQDTIIQGCDSITGAGWYSEVITIPRPNHQNQYYVFSVGLDSPYNQGCFYTLVDMNLNSGMGSVVKQNIKINNATSGDCLTAVKHGNGQDWWVINKYSKLNAPNYNNRFFVYKVTADSIYAPLIQDFNDATDADFQKISWHPSFNKFMLINGGGYMSEFSFNRCTGNIALIRNIYPEQTSNFNRRFWEGAYSPSGDVFYVTTTGIFKTDTLYALQYNLGAANIPASCDTLDKRLHPIIPGAFRLAPNNKIYLSMAYDCNIFPYCYPYPDSVRNYINENLTVINYPDSLGATCGYSPFSFYLGGKRTYYGLPNNPNYSLGPLVGSICDTITTVPKIPKKITIGKFYPNPASGEVTLLASKAFSSDNLLQIYNSLGDLIVSYSLPFNATTFKFSSAALQPGVYFCKLSSTSLSRQIEKLVVLR